MGESIKSIRETHQLGTSTREWVVSSERSVRPGKTCARICGYTEAGPGYQFGRIAPPFSQVLVTEMGEGSVFVDGRWLPCVPGTAYITAPRATCAYRVTPARGVWRVHWCIYGEACLLPALPPGAAPRLVTVEATSFRHAVEGCCHEKSTRHDPGVLGLWTALVDHAVWRMLDIERGDPRLDRLWLAIRRDLGGSWTLRRMAREAGLGPESLRRLCQRHLKISPGAQLTRIRMQAAADLLRHTEEKLDALAVRLGYADAFSFSTAFRRTMGMPPSCYREGGAGRPSVSSGKRRT